MRNKIISKAQQIINSLPFLKHHFCRKTAAILMTIISFIQSCLIPLTAFFGYKTYKNIDIVSCGYLLLCSIIIIVCWYIWKILELIKKLPE